MKTLTTILIITAFTLSQPTQASCGVFAEEWARVSCEQIRAQQRAARTGSERDKQTARQLWMLGPDKSLNDMTRQQLRATDPTYNWESNADAILRHGAGGCTPNYATGGCL